MANSQVLTPPSNSNRNRRISWTLNCESSSSNDAPRLIRNDTDCSMATSQSQNSDCEVIFKHSPPKRPSLNETESNHVLMDYLSKIKSKKKSKKKNKKRIPEKNQRKRRLNEIVKCNQNEPSRKKIKMIDDTNVNNQNSHNNQALSLLSVEVNPNSSDQFNEPMMSMEVNEVAQLLVDLKNKGAPLHHDNNDFRQDFLSTIQSPSDKQIEKDSNKKPTKNPSVIDEDLLSSSSSSSNLKQPLPLPPLTSLLNKQQINDIEELKGDQLQVAQNLYKDAPLPFKQQQQQQQQQSLLPLSPMVLPDFSSMIMPSFIQPQQPVSPENTEDIPLSAEEELSSSENSDDIPIMIEKLSPKRKKKKTCKSSLSSTKKSKSGKKRQYNRTEWKLNSKAAGDGSGNRIWIEDGPYKDEVLVWTGNYVYRGKHKKQVPTYICIFNKEPEHEVPGDKITEHRNKCLKLKPFECSICGKTFGDYKHLVQHEEIHNVAQKYQCEFCGKIYAHQRTLLYQHDCPKKRKNKNKKKTRKKSKKKTRKKSKKKAKKKAKKKTKKKANKKTNKKKISNSSAPTINNEASNNNNNNNAQSEREEQKQQQQHEISQQIFSKVFAADDSIQNNNNKEILKKNDWIALQKENGTFDFGRVDQIYEDLGGVEISLLQSNETIRMDWNTFKYRIIEDGTKNEDLHKFQRYLVKTWLFENCNHSDSLEQQHLFNEIQIKHSLLDARSLRVILKALKDQKMIQWKSNKIKLLLI